METINLTYSGKTKSYKIADRKNGKPVLYPAGTSDQVIKWFERARLDQTRIKICLGDIETGRDWNESFDVTGRVGLSNGTDGYYPLLIHNARSIGGGILMADCVVKIEASKGGFVFYQHPNYHKEC